MYRTNRQINQFHQFDALKVMWLWVVCVPCNCGILETKIRICSICSPHYIQHHIQHHIQLPQTVIGSRIAPPKIIQKWTPWESEGKNCDTVTKILLIKGRDQWGECMLSKLVINGKTSIVCHTINCNWNKEVNRKLKLSSLFLDLWYIREGVTKKSCCSFGFCPNEGGGRALPKFLSPFHKCIFGR